MGISILILFVMAALLAGVCLGAAILYLIGKIFKVQNVSYKTSIKILLLGGSISSALSIALAFAFISLGVNVELGKSINYILGFLVFYFFFKKYWQLGWIKSFGIYAIVTIAWIILFLGIAMPIRLFIEAPFVVSGDAMNPTYPSGEYLLINEVSKNFSRGDVVVFRYPESSSEFLIKRIIGLPADTITVQNGKVLVNGKVLNEPYVSGSTSGNVSLVLAPDTYFAMGDNRQVSYDSRNFGPIQKSTILGKVLLDVAKF